MKIAILTKRVECCDELAGWFHCRRRGFSERCGFAQKAGLPANRRPRYASLHLGKAPAPAALPLNTSNSGLSVMRKGAPMALSEKDVRGHRRVRKRSH